MEAHFVLNLLGQFQLTVDNQPLIGLTSEKIQALIAYLAVEQGRTHTREYLAELLWPDRPEGVARQNLRQSLSRLQRAIPTGDASLLQITRKEIRFLRDSNIQVDVIQFLTLIEATRTHAHDSVADCPDCCHNLALAVALYRGDFLIGCHLNSPLFEEWRLLKEEWLRNEMLQALDQLIQHHERCQQWREVYRYGQRSIVIDSLREVTHQQVMRSLAYLGQHNAAIEQYALLVQLLQDEFGVVPSTTTTALYNAIRDQQVGTEPAITARVASVNPQVAIPTNLPVQHTPFVGRQLESLRITARMAEPECHLLTLVGPGGAGKTRLALEMAAQQIQRIPQPYPDGIFFVALNTVEDEEQLLTAIAAAIDCRLPDGTQRSEERQGALLDYLRTKCLLLVLDNYEQLVACTDLVLAMIAEAPGVQLLVTSRVPLHLRAEWLFDIAGLNYPDAQDLVIDTLPALLNPQSAEALVNFESVQFFWRAAQRLLVDFPFSAQTMLAIGRLCRLTEGLPLALELAAAQIRQVPLPVLVEAVQQNMDHLTTTMRDVPARHRSLRAVFDHSWLLLPPPLQAVFRRLAVFRGTFVAEAAIAVVGCERDALTQLVAYSLLREDSVDAQASRYALHEVLRQYAIEQLQTDPAEEQQVKRRHGNYYLSLVAAQSAQITNVEAPQAIAALQRAIANIRVGWQWAIDTQEHALIDAAIAPLLRYFVMTGQSEEGGHWVDYALRQAIHWEAESTEISPEKRIARQHLHAELHATRARLFHKQAQYRAAIDHAEQALTIAVACAASHAAASALMYWGVCLINMGDYDEAETKLHQALAWAEPDGQEAVACDVLRTLGTLAGRRNNLAAARQYYSDALAISQRIGHLRGTSATLGNLGLICRQLGHFDESRRLLLESLAIHRQIEDRSSEGRTLILLGELSLDLEEYKAAEAYCKNALQLLRSLSEEQYVADALTVLGTLSLRQNKSMRAQEYWEAAAKIYMAVQEWPMLEEVHQYLNGLKDLSEKQHNTI